MPEQEFGLRRGFRCPYSAAGVEEFRKGPSEEEDTGEEERIDGVIFATTEHGDILCFNVAERNGDYPVYLYNHEMDEFEPFTKNFAACIKRLAGA